jgi:hypothetical protein
MSGLHWSPEEEKLLKIDDYRRLICGKKLDDQILLTEYYANIIYESSTLLQLNRGHNGVILRLPYLDNLYAGVLEKEAYAIKDQYKYESSPREDGSKEFNSCNRSHPYNGKRPY